MPVARPRPSVSFSIPDAARPRRSARTSALADLSEEDEERGITITSAATTCFWNDHLINIIDTPSHIDFLVEVERSLRVIDGAVAVFDATIGVEPQSETAWRQADKHHVPRLCFVNKMDRPGADFDRIVGMLSERVGARPLIVQLPIGNDGTFSGVVDLVRNKAFVWKDEGLGAVFTETAIPAEVAGQAAQYRTALIEAAVEQDADATEAFLAGTMPTEEALKSLIRKGTCNLSFVPVLCGRPFGTKAFSRCWTLLSIIRRLRPMSVMFRGSPLTGRGRGALPRTVPPKIPHHSRRWCSRSCRTRWWALSLSGGSTPGR